MVIDHIGFAVGDFTRSRAFHAAALAAGGIDNGAPGIRAQHHTEHDGALITDLNGHNIEAVRQLPEG